MKTNLKMYISYEEPFNGNYGVMEEDRKLLEIDASMEW